MELLVSDIHPMKQDLPTWPSFHHVLGQQDVVVAIQFFHQFVS